MRQFERGFISIEWNPKPTHRPDIAESLLDYAVVYVHDVFEGLWYQIEDEADFDHRISWIESLCWRLICLILVFFMAPSIAQLIQQKTNNVDQRAEDEIACFYRRFITPFGIDKWFPRLLSQLEDLYQAMAQAAMGLPAFLSFAIGMFLFLRIIGYCLWLDSQLVVPSRPFGPSADPPADPAARPSTTTNAPIPTQKNAEQMDFICEILPMAQTTGSSLDQRDVQADKHDKLLPYIEDQLREQNPARSRDDLSQHTSYVHEYVCIEVERTPVMGEDMDEGEASNVGNRPVRLWGLDDAYKLLNGVLLWPTAPWALARNSSFGIFD